jgi:hypothetical protein
MSISGKKVNKTNFEIGLRLKIKFLESSFSKEFVRKIGDETTRIDTGKLELLLLNQIGHDLEQSKRLTLAEVVEIISKETFKAKNEFLKERADVLAKDMEGKVKTCSEQRNKAPEKADKAGNELYKSVGGDLRLLEKMLGQDNLTYTNVADAVAEEILQCSIDFYNKSRNPEAEGFVWFEKLNKVIESPRKKTIDGAQTLLTEAIPLLGKIKTAIAAQNKKSGATVQNKRAVALDLLEKACSIAAGQTIRQRCEDNRNRLPNDEKTDWNAIYLSVSTRIANDALMLIVEEIKNSSGMTPQRRDSVKRMLEQIVTMDLTPDFRKTVEDIKKGLDGGGRDSSLNTAIEALTKLLNASKTITPDEVEPHLKIVQNALGKNNEEYMQISSVLANKILDNLIGAVNEAQEYVNNAYDKISALRLLRDIVNGAMSDINRIEAWDLTPDFRNRLKTNKSVLLNLSNQLCNIGGGGGGNKSKSGCYIATMAYGDYNHPQVQVLRRFRDEVLAQSVAGRLFIWIYYCISPQLVKLLREQKAIHCFVRTILNQFIKIIQTK